MLPAPAISRALAKSRSVTFAIFESYLWWRGASVPKHYLLSCIDTEDQVLVDLLILRHGQSEWNAQGRWQGQADPPLTELGERQAHAAAEQLLNAKITFDTVASSDLQRARRTAEILSAALNVDDFASFSEFRERSAGPWQGLTREEIETSWPNAIAEQRWPKGYESDDSVAARVLPTLHQLAETCDHLLLVGHAGLIRALDRTANASDVAITNHLSGRWYELRDHLIPRDGADFSREDLEHELE
tara:strand:+ start:11862 stop:12596 length:735 start_codon:yes stop_codon:yes gene_type:complete